MTEEQPKESASQKYRRKIKENPDLRAEHLLRERSRDKKRRDELKSKMEVDQNLKAIARLKSKERMQASRKRRKEEQISLEGKNYSSPRTLGKAVAKVKRNLPASPTKAVAVVKRIAAEFMDVPSSEPPKVAKKITDDVKKSIHDFFNRDDISRQMPGMKDVKSIRINSNTKIKVQKRTMIISIREAFELFKETIPEASIGKTVFYSERPANILPVNETPHNVCVCTTHSNFISLLVAIAKFTTDIPKSHKDLLKQLSCSINSEDCMSNSCDACKTSLIWDIALESNPIVNWKTWIYQNKRPKQIMISKPFNEALDELHDLTAKFKLHYFVKNAQSDYFQNAKQDLTSDQAIVQIDFAENYALINQDEIQSAHWSHEQVTLFTCCVWTTDKIHSIVIVSDELSHNKYTVYLFLQKIFEYIKTISDNITYLYIFSDNCAAQFKNRFLMASLNEFKEKYEFTHLEWNFFAASHGKGAVDGIGGSVKRSVWIAVKSRRALINNAKEFYDLARNLSKNVVFIFVTKNEVEEGMPMLDDKWQGLANIPGIQAKHFFQPLYGDTITVGRTALSRLKSTLVLKTFQNNHSNAESDWDSDDLQPLVNYTTSEEILTPGGMYSVLDQCEAFLPSTKLRVSDVYSDSSDAPSDDDEFATPLEHLIIPPEILPESTSIVPKDICAGSYVLVQLFCKPGKKQYRYVGVCLRDLDDNGDVQIQFLKSIDGKSFTKMVNDIADVSYNDILVKLEEPTQKIEGDNIFMEFSSKIDIVEKK